LLRRLHTSNNLLQNGGFEIDFLFWHPSASTSIVLDDAGGGTKCGQVSRTSGGNEYFFSDRISITGGETLLFEFSHRYTSHTSGGLHAYVRYYDSGGFIGQTLKQPANTSTWTERSYEITTNTNATQIDILFWLDSSTTVGTHRVDNVKVFREDTGNGSNNYSPKDKTRYTENEVELSWDSSGDEEYFNVFIGQDSNDVNNAQMEYLKSDADQSKITDYFDLLVLTFQWLTDPSGQMFSADTNGDNTVDFNDFSRLALDWNKGPVSIHYDKTKSLSGLELGKTYYWRVDEVNETNPLNHKGDIQSFTVGYITIDDMEFYDVLNPVGNTWIDGSVNSTGSAVSLNTSDVFEGSQSLQFDYVNNTTPYYSQITRNITTHQDWLGLNADTLAIYFMGDPANLQQKMYLFIEDTNSSASLIDYAPRYGNMIDLKNDKWQIWYVPFDALSGVDLSSIAKISLLIGDGTPSAGGTDTLYIDEIRLERHDQKLFDKGSLPADIIDVVILAGATNDTKLAAITLQGQINKLAKSRVFWTNGPGTDTT